MGQWRHLPSKKGDSATSPETEKVQERTMSDLRTNATPPDSEKSQGLEQRFPVEI